MAARCTTGFFLSLSLDIDLPLLQHHQQNIFMFKKVNALVRFTGKCRSLFDPSLVPFWSIFGPPLVPLWSLSVPSLVPLMFFVGLSLVPLCYISLVFCPYFVLFFPFFVLLWYLFGFSNMIIFFLFAGNFLLYENHKIDFT